MTTAVEDQSGVCWRALISLTMNFCSSRGSEYPACPSWYPGALRKLTAGRWSGVGDGPHQGVEVAGVVVVVGGVELRDAADEALRVGADRRQRCRRQVVRVGGRGVVLERLVVGDVVVLGAVV